MAQQCQFCCPKPKQPSHLASRRCELLSWGSAMKRFEASKAMITFRKRTSEFKTSSSKLHFLHRPSTMEELEERVDCRLRWSLDVGGNDNVQFQIPRLSRASLSLSLEPTTRRVDRLVFRGRSHLRLCWVFCKMWPKKWKTKKLSTHPISRFFRCLA